eukprot:GEMP01050367.1.p1 GENE.GEMP01050367.1~~GEMP01050367.1.p1  ORF type:complete len:220 (+),score=45.76 GEMP01050367.1:84-743(+)
MRALLVCLVALSAVPPAHGAASLFGRAAPIGFRNKLTAATPEIVRALGHKVSKFRDKVLGPEADALVDTGVFPNGLHKVNFAVELPRSVVLDFTNGAAVYRSSAPYFGDDAHYRNRKHLLFTKEDARHFLALNDKLRHTKITRFVNLNGKNFDRASRRNLRRIGVKVSWVPMFDIGPYSGHEDFAVRRRLFSPSPFKLLRIARILNHKRGEDKRAPPKK